MSAPRGFRRRGAPVVLLAACVALAGSGADAQSGAGFEIRRSTIDGGGGRSSGGAFEATGTVGQPDVGVTSGGVFEFRGGLWAGPAAVDANDGVFEDGFE